MINDKRSSRLWQFQLDDKPLTQKLIFKIIHNMLRCKSRHCGFQCELTILQHKKYPHLGHIGDDGRKMWI